jgi:ABC-type Mn2+/Zn2+ transport system permease subunit
MNKWIKLLIIAVVVGILGYRIGMFFSMSPPRMAGAMSFLILLYGFLLIKEHEKLKK